MPLLRSRAEVRRARRRFVGRFFLVMAVGVGLLVSGVAGALALGW